MSTIAFLFPGQSSRYPGMLQKLLALHSKNAEILSAASDTLGRDLRAHFGPENEAAFDRNVDVQVGVFLANHMFLTILDGAGVTADLSLGLSLGEWNHLVHIGVLGFTDALRAVQARGEAYDAGPRGFMAAVQPMGLEELEQVLERVRHLGVVEAVNLNSPTQQVISGEQAAVEAAVALLEEESFARPIITERKVPMHASLFEPVGRAFRETLEKLDFRPARLPYIPNRLARVIEAPDREELVDLLSTHVHRPVLWQKSIDLVRELRPDVTFVEVGPKSVLYGLLRKSWFRASKHCTDSQDDTAAHLEATIEALRQVRAQ